MDTRASTTVIEAERIEHGLKWNPVKAYAKTMPRGVGSPRMGAVRQLSHARWRKNARNRRPLHCDPYHLRPGGLYDALESTHCAPALYSFRSNSLVRTNDTINSMTLEQLLAGTHRFWTWRSTFPAEYRGDAF